MEAIPLALGILKRRRYIESESSSSSDEEWEDFVQPRGKRELRVRISDYIQVVDAYLDHEFKSHFRMSRHTFDVLHATIRPDLLRGMKGCPMIPSRIQLMIALWKMAALDSYRSVCDRFDGGKASALRAVRRVTRALFMRSSTFIQWPNTDRARSIMRGFEEASGFPKTIGAIDGTQIRINAPSKNPADYINRKGFHSIQLQLVCDHRTLITHAFTGFPGSVHDQRVFRQSEVADYLNDNSKFLYDSHILADAACQLHQHLLTPCRDNGHLTERQRMYNYRQSSARVVVERCIGLLKGRMRSLLHCLPMTRVDLMAEYVVACCVIHNICTLQGNEITVISVPSTPLERAMLEDPPELDQGRVNLGTHKRNLIKDTLQ